MAGRCCGGILRCRCGNNCFCGRTCCGCASRGRASSVPRINKKLRRNRRGQQGIK